MTAKSDLYVSLLQARGFAATVDEDDDVIFEYEDITCVLDGDDSDPGFFSMLMPVVDRLETDEERAVAPALALEAGLKIKAAKMLVVGDSVHAACQQFITEPGQADAFFERMLGSTQAVALEYWNLKRERLGPAAVAPTE